MVKRVTDAVGCAAVALIVAGVTNVRVEVQQAATLAEKFDKPSALAQPRMMKKNELITLGSHAQDIIDVQQIWAAYGFFIDSGNGEGAASLYAEDGIIRHFWNNKGASYEPHGGIGSFKTPYGADRGGECVVRGRKQIQQYFGGERKTTPWPGWGHHTSPNSMVKVSEDGKTAVLTTAMLIASVNEKGEGRLTTGEYRVVFKKSPTDGWLIAEQNNFADRARGNNRCDSNGPSQTR
jgi:hypothetical protein